MSEEEEAGDGAEYDGDDYGARGIAACALWAMFSHLFVSLCVFLFRGGLLPGESLLVLWAMLSHLCVHLFFSRGDRRGIFLLDNIGKTDQFLGVLREQCFHINVFNCFFFIYL